MRIPIYVSLVFFSLQQCSACSSFFSSFVRESTSSLPWQIERHLFTTHYANYKLWNGKTQREKRARERWMWEYSRYSLHCLSAKRKSDDATFTSFHAFHIHENRDEMSSTARRCWSIMKDFLFYVYIHPLPSSRDIFTRWIYPSFHLFSHTRVATISFNEAPNNSSLVVDDGIKPSGMPASFTLSLSLSSLLLIRSFITLNSISPHKPHQDFSLSCGSTHREMRDERGYMAYSNRIDKLWGKVPESNTKNSHDCEQWRKFSERSLGVGFIKFSIKSILQNWV